MTEAELDALAKQESDEHAMQSGCTDYACCCHAKVPVLVAEVRRLQAENKELLALLGDRVLDSDLAAHAVQRETLRCVGILADLMEREEESAQANRPYAIGALEGRMEQHLHASRRLAHAGCAIAKPQPVPAINRTEPFCSAPR